MPLQVGNLPYRFTADQLAGLFNSEGFSVNRACIDNRGTGIAELIDSRHDKEALESLNNRDFGGRVIKVYILDAAKANSVLGRDYEDGFYYDRSGAMDDEDDIEYDDEE